MLAGIINTIIMALGIATGNISSNAYKGGNVFNEERNQSQQIKRAIQNFEVHVGWNQAASYSDSVGWNYKYYIDGQRTYTSPIGQLTNTSYESRWSTSNNNSSNARNATIIRIDRYRTTTNNTFRLDLNIAYSVRSNPNHTGINTVGVAYSSYLTYQNLDAYIDLTTYQLSDLDPNNIWDNIQLDQNKIITSGYDAQNVNMQSAGTDAPNNIDMIATLQATNIESDTFWLYVRSYAIAYSQWHGDIILTDTPQTIYWSGEYLQSNYEVIDLPGVMYTILTMPFSFISTAFNLTVFPGTPYALNFGNLFLTIIAIFILLWLIKKVFK